MEIMDVALLAESSSMAGLLETCGMFRVVYHTDRQQNEWFNSDAQLSLSFENCVFEETLETLTSKQKNGRKHVTSERWAFFRS